VKIRNRRTEKRTNIRFSAKNLAILFPNGKFSKLAYKRFFEKTEKLKFLVRGSLKNYKL
jgi:hypothetical protein